MGEEFPEPPTGRPARRSRRWSLWVGIAAFLVGPTVGIMTHLLARNGKAGQPSGDGTTATAINLGLPALVLSIVGIIVAAGTLRRERSSSTTIGLALSLLTLTYFAYIAVSELIG